MKKLFLICAGTLSILASSYSNASTTINVGGLPIQINGPIGYINACEKSEEFRKIFESSTPPMNTLRACFIENEEFRKFPDVDLEVDNPAFQVFTIKSIEQRNATETEFASFRQAIVKQQDSMFSNMPKKLKSIVDSTMKTSTQAAAEIVGEGLSITDWSVVPLGVFSNTSSHVAFAAIRNTKVNTESGAITVSEVIATSAILKNGKVLMLNVQKQYKSSADIAMAKELIVKWSTEI